MPSSLACIGLDVADLDELNEHLSAMATQVAGRVGGVETVRYADESGARVMLVQDAEGTTLDVVPSYDARAGVLVADLGPHGSYVAADVVDDDGATVTRLVADLAQRRHLSGTVAGPLRGALVVLGVEMSVHADQAAFDASPDAALGDAGDDGPRFAAESVLSYGIFGDAADAQPTAYLAGTVLDAETRTHAVTEQVFHVARVRSAGFEATVCLPGSASPTAPAPGNVVAGSAYLVLETPTLWTVEPPRRQRRRRKA
jgi:hypothetical protein